MHSMMQLDIEDSSIWQDRRFTDLTSSETGDIFFGGSWLEEKIFIAGCRRPSADMTCAYYRTSSRRVLTGARLLVLRRLVLHSILPTAERQSC